MAVEQRERQTKGRSRPRRGATSRRRRRRSVVRGPAGKGQVGSDTRSPPARAPADGGPRARRAIDPLSHRRRRHARLPPGPAGRLPSSSMAPRPGARCRRARHSGPRLAGRHARSAGTRGAVRVSRRFAEPFDDLSARPRPCASGAGTGRCHLLAASSRARCSASPPSTGWCRSVRFAERRASPPPRAEDFSRRSACTPRCCATAWFHRTRRDEYYRHITAESSV